ncbi:hypothetical protein TNCV_4622381 [Trichonephila clavipes]|nr:hypothetical protein TNCV_4622381 [Trichonephila clavipes]
MSKTRKTPAALDGPNVSSKEFVALATRGLLVTGHVTLNYGQVTWTTPELAPSSPNYHTNWRTFELSTDLTCNAALHGGPNYSRNDIMEFVQRSKNMIDADSYDENKMNAAAPVPSSSEMTKVISYLDHIPMVK